MPLASAYFGRHTKTPGQPSGIGRRSLLLPSWCSRSSPKRRSWASPRALWLICHWPIAPGSFPGATETSLLRHRALHPAPGWFRGTWAYVLVQDPRRGRQWPREMRPALELGSCRTSYRSLCPPLVRIVGPQQSRAPWTCLKASPSIQSLGSIAMVEHMASAPRQRFVVAPDPSCS